MSLTLESRSHKGHKVQVYARLMCTLLFCFRNNKVRTAVLCVKRYFFVRKQCKVAEFLWVTSKQSVKKHVWLLECKSILFHPGK